MALDQFLASLVQMLNGMTPQRRPDFVDGSFPSDRELTAQPGGITPFATLPTFGAAPGGTGAPGSGGTPGAGGGAPADATTATPGLGPKKIARLDRKADRIEQREGRLQKRLGKLEARKQTKPRIKRENRIEHRITAMQSRVGRIRHRIG